MTNDRPAARPVTLAARDDGGMSSPTQGLAPADRGRLVLLTTSPRVATGLLTWQAWTVLRDGRVVVADAAHPLLDCLRAADIEAEVLPVDHLADSLIGLATVERRPVVYVADHEKDGAFARSLSAALVGAPKPSELPEVEILPGSYDVAGARLLDLVATMERLRSPGGCPWDAEQTHESLATYLVEETYETLDAIDTGDRVHLREELGDLLLQVMFHARIAEEHPVEPWSIDDVAEEIVDKLVRRHPHVFGQGSAPETSGEIQDAWEVQKGREKGRTSSVDGVPFGLPALSLAAQLIHRAETHGVAEEPVDGEDLGSRLMALVVEGRHHGQDAEGELRRAARRYAERVRSAEERARAAASG